jgi:hypothetical protein
MTVINKIIGTGRFVLLQICEEKWNRKVGDANIFRFSKTPHCKRGAKITLDVLGLNILILDVDDEDNVEDVNTIFGKLLKVLQL